jgi:hypothetical protein
MHGYVIHARKNRTDEDAVSRGFDSWIFLDRAWEHVPRKDAGALLQLRVFGLGSLQEREAGAGVLPETQERRQSFASL